jgi:hypothetical protein
MAKTVRNAGRVGRRGITLDKLIQAVEQLEPGTVLPWKPAVGPELPSRLERAFMATCAPNVCLGDVLKDLRKLGRRRKPAARS